MFYRKYKFVTVVALALGMAILAPNISSADSRYITVTGSGSFSVTPDAVQIQALVSYQAKSNSIALSQANLTSSAVNRVLQNNNIDKKDINSTNINVAPVYNWTSAKGNVLVGYQASQSYTILIRDTSVAGKILDQLVAAGGNNLQIQGINAIVTNSASALQSARANAVSDAKSKASDYANFLGVQLGQVIYLTENSDQNQIQPFEAARTTVGNSNSQVPTTIDLGMQSFSASVTVQWAIN
jgi:uncharacterized protein